MNDLQVKTLVSIFIFATVFTIVYYYHDSIQLPHDYSPSSVQTYDDDWNEYQMAEYRMDEYRNPEYRMPEHFAPREYIRLITIDNE